MNFGMPTIDNPTNRRAFENASIYTEKDKNNLLAYLRDAGQNLMNGWNEAKAVEEFKNQLKIFKLDDTSLLQEMESSVNDRYQAKILQTVLDERLINLRENGVTQRGLGIHYGIEKKVLSEKEVESVKANIETLINLYQPKLRNLEGTNDLKQATKKEIKENLKFHLGEYNELIGRDPGLDKLINKLQAIYDFAEMA